MYIIHYIFPPIYNYPRERHGNHKSQKSHFLISRGYSLRKGMLNVNEIC